MGRFNNVGIDLDLTFGQTLNDNFNVADAALSENKADITQHKQSTQAHPATAIPYSGEVAGASNVKVAVDNLQSQVNTIVANGDSSVAAAQAAINAYGFDYHNLKKRLDDEYEKMSIRLKKSFSTVYQRAKRKTALCTLISDDGASADFNIMKSLLANKNVKYGMGLITKFVNTNGYMTWDQIAEMVSDGHEVLCHSHNHEDYRTLTTDQMIADLETALNILAEHSYYPDAFVYPFNSHDDNTVDVVQRYFSHAYTKTATNQANIVRNFPTINNQRIARMAVGSYFDNPVEGFPSDTSSLEYYKARADEAKANDNLLVIVLHPAHPNFTATQQQYLSELIDYIRSLEIEIVPPSEAFDRYGNIVQIGEKPSNRYWIDANGIEVYNTENRIKFVQANSFTPADAYTTFEQGKVIRCEVTAAFAAANGFPSPRAGIYETDRTSANYYVCRQTYTVAPTTLSSISGRRNKVYERYVNSDGSWTPFRLVDWIEYDKTTATVNVTANSTYDLAITDCTELLFGDIVTVVPYNSHTIPPGLIFNLIKIEDTKITLRFANVTSESITLPQTRWFVAVNPR